jgi:transcriptional regulator with XRE-family HTH domain
MVATPRTLTFGAAVHFGRQVKKERLVRHWSLEELARQTGIDHGHLSRIERGLRPPTEKIAVEMDKAFPNREGWFTECWPTCRTSRSRCCPSLAMALRKAN